MLAMFSTLDVDYYNHAQIVVIMPLSVYPLRPCSRTSHPRYPHPRIAYPRTYS